MKNKIAFLFLALVGTLILGVVAALLAATWGGNYAVDFEVLGTRGYEATGAIGWWVGLGLGILMSSVLYIERFRLSSHE